MNQDPIEFTSQARSKRYEQLDLLLSHTEGCIQSPAESALIDVCKALFAETELLHDELDQFKMAMRVI